jgi:hypothetical protein
LGQQQLSDWEKQQGKNARHRALIMQILRAHPDGLTTQQIVEKELDTYGYTFLTDNRLRELRARGWVRSMGDKPQRWIPVLKEASA